ncbi:MAG: hypothetical protein ABI266_05700 [Ginsengibacter sp.]
MKNLKNIIFVLTLVIIASSCKKNVVEYESTAISGLAEFQLHYFVPIAAGDTNNIYQVQINDQLYANNTSPLLTYNAIPNGSVGKFFTTKVGENNIKLYKGTTLNLTYNQNVTLTKGKQNVFVYDFNKPPIVFDNGFPYQSPTTDSTSKTGWVKFYNFLYEAVDVPTTMKLQYQWQYTMDINSGQKSDWINLGKAVSFGEATGWEPITIIKTDLISSGSARIDYRIRMIDATGNDTGSLVVLNASNKLVDYSDYWNASIGRRYHHVLSGIRTQKPTSAVRVFTAL